jgi:hypothetical protein
MNSVLFLKGKYALDQQMIETAKVSIKNETNLLTNKEKPNKLLLTKIKKLPDLCLALIVSFMELPKEVFNFILLGKRIYRCFLINKNTWAIKWTTKNIYFPYQKAPNKPIPFVSNLILKDDANIEEIFNNFPNLRGIKFALPINKQFSKKAMKILTKQGIFLEELSFSCNCFSENQAISFSKILTNLTTIKVNFFTINEDIMAELGKCINVLVQNKKNLHQIKLYRYPDNQLKQVLIKLAKIDILITLELQLNSDVTDLTLQHLEQTLNKNSKLQNFQLNHCICANNGILNNRFQYINNGLKNNNQLQKLDLSTNDFSLINIKDFLEMLKNCPNIKQLILFNCKLNDEKIIAINAVLIVNNKALRQLELNFNQITDKSGNSIAKLISDKPTLKEVDLTLNSINTTLYFQQAINQNKSFRLLNLAGTPIKDKATIKKNLCCFKF